jgi:hypothetical protein
MPKYTKNRAKSSGPPPDSRAFLAFAAAAEKKKAQRQKLLADFNESGAAHAQALGLVHQVHQLTPDHSARPVVSGKESRANASKRAGKRQQASAADVLDNKEIKASDAQHPYAKLKSNRTQNLAVAQTLYERAYERNDSLHKTAHKLRVCSTAGAFRMHSPEVCHKTGQALCRSRVCPTCQKALSHKRRAAFLGFFDLNREVMQKFYFYHMVLTLRHSRAEDIRDELYTKQLIEYFKQLRGTSFNKNSAAGLCSGAAEYWNKRVAGGIYSIETVPGKDGSPHIHLHIFLLAKMPLWRNGQAGEFQKEMRSRWLSITGAEDVRGASSQVHVEPVYTWKLDEFGRPVLDKKGQKVKDYVTKQHKRALPGAAAETDEVKYQHLRAGVAECAKYTLKTDEASLSQFSDSFLYDLIETRHRYYGRFGCLHSRTKESKQFKELNRLNSDFKDLEQVDADALRQMTNPETGEVVLKMNTSMIISSFRNMTPQTTALSTLTGTAAVVNEYYYSVKDMSKVVEYASDADAAVAKALSVTLYKRYEAENDIATIGDEKAAALAAAADVQYLVDDLGPIDPGVEKCPTLGEVRQAQKSTKSLHSKRLNTIICPHYLPLQSTSWLSLWGVHAPRPAGSAATYAKPLVYPGLQSVSWQNIGRTTKPAWSPF